jgi:hypothetical protein
MRGKSKTHVEGQDLRCLARDGGTAMLGLVALQPGIILAKVELGDGRDYRPAGAVLVQKWSDRSSGWFRGLEQVLAVGLDDGPLRGAAELGEGLAGRGLGFVLRIR